jgi:parallel beta-helix repeat protein
MENDNNITAKVPIFSIIITYVLLCFSPVCAFSAEYETSFNSSGDPSVHNYFVGALNGQDSWGGTDSAVSVQTSVINSGDQAVQVGSVDGVSRHAWRSFSDFNSGEVRVDVYIQPPAYYDSTAPSIIIYDGALSILKLEFAFGTGNNNGPMWAYFTGGSREFVDVNWFATKFQKLSFLIDLSAKTYSILVDDAATNIIDFGFVDSSSAGITKVQFESRNGTGGSSSAMFVDDFKIAGVLEPDYATGYESLLDPSGHNFALGALDGQDSWGATDSLTVVVQETVTHLGSHAVQIGILDGVEKQAWRDFSGYQGGKVRVRVYLQPAAYYAAAPSISLYDGADTICQLKFEEGESADSGRMRFYGDTTTYVSGGWYGDDFKQVELVADFDSKTVDLFVEGYPTNINGAGFISPSASEISKVIFTSTNGSGPNATATYIDDFLIGFFSDVPVFATDDIILASPYTDVRYFGAVGDGLTDNTAAFSSANAHLSNGGTIFVPEGTWLVNGPIVLSDDVNLVGTGSGSIIRCNSMSTGFGAVTVFGANNIISDVRFQGVSEDVNGSTAVDVRGINIKVLNCYVEGFRDGLLLKGSYISAENNRVEGCHSNGIYIYNLNNSIIGNNVVSSCGYDGIYGFVDGPGGVGSYYLTTVIISNNRLRGNGGNGIELYSKMERIEVHDNVCTGNSANGIYIGSGTNSSDAKVVSITGNICRNNTTGIKIKEIEHFVLSENACSRNSSHGIRVERSNKGIVANNTVEENSGHGISFYGYDVSNGCEYIGVLGNTAIDNGGGTGSGIYIEQYCSWLWVTSNSAYNLATASQLYGVRVEDNNNSIYVINNFAPNSYVAGGIGTYVSGSNNVSHSNQVADSPIAILPVNDPTPGVYGGAAFMTANTAPTTITDFVGGTPGQIIRVIVPDGNTSIQHNPSYICLQGAQNWLPAAGTIELVNTGGKWLELTRAQLPAVVVGAIYETGFELSGDPSGYGFAVGPLETQGGWNATDDEVTIQTSVTYSGTQAVQVGNSIDGLFRSLWRSFDGYDTGAIILEAYVKIGGYYNAAPRMEVRDAGKILAAIEFRGGIASETGGIWAEGDIWTNSGSTWDSTEWIKIGVQFDLGNKKFNVMINSATVAEGLSFADPGARGVTEFQFLTWNGTAIQSTPCYMDDFTIKEIIVIESMVLDVSGFAIKWKSKPGTTYTVYWKEGAAGEWSKAEDVASGGTLTQWIDTGGPGRPDPRTGAVVKRFYMVKEAD